MYGEQIMRIDGNSHTVSFIKKKVSPTMGYTNDCMVKSSDIDVNKHLLVNKFIAFILFNNLSAICFWILPMS